MRLRAEVTELLDPPGLSRPDPLPLAWEPSAAAPDPPPLWQEYDLGTLEVRAQDALSLGRTRVGGISSAQHSRRTLQERLR